MPVPSLGKQLICFESGNMQALTHEAALVSTWTVKDGVTALYSRRGTAISI